MDVETGLRLYRIMVECRTFEVRAQELFFEGLVRGTTHLGPGQEAVAAGFAAAMREDDYTFATYRGHNHALARGTPMGPLYAELFGRANGLLGGKGGSMHITDVEHHMMGSYAIVGAHLPIALGAAWSAQYRKSGQVAVCFFGDGTTNIGAFHEALNMAAVWKAPVVFVCENNQYMEYTPIGAVTAVEHPAADRASCLWPRVDPDRRQRRRGGVRDGHAGHRTGTERRRAVAGRGPDVPSWRALPRGPRQVPAGRRGRGVAGEGPDSAAAKQAHRARRPGGGPRRDRRGGQGGRGGGRGRGEGWTGAVGGGARDPGMGRRGLVVAER